MSNNIVKGNFPIDPKARDLYEALDEAMRPFAAELSIAAVFGVIEIWKFDLQREALEYKEYTSE